MTATTAPLASFGLIADVQYADVDDGWNYLRTSQRFYRHALQVLGWAVDAWIEEAKSSPSTMCFAVDLGDLVDGKNAPLGLSRAALADTLVHFNAFQAAVGPIHHCCGNHEMYNFTRQEYIHEVMLHTSSPCMPPTAAPPRDAAVAYYNFAIPQLPSFEFVILDAYGLSVIGSPPNSVEHAAAVELLAKENPNENKNSSINMSGIDQRFVEYNGAIDAVQMTWLAGVLQRAGDAARDVIVFSHVPLHEAASGGHPAALLWNCDALAALFRRFAHCVRVVFTGHTHSNGYHRCESGVHFVGLHAALECDPDDLKQDRAYASVDVFPTSVRIRGTGKIPSRELSWRR
ncbi:Aste57867_2755 [Aphanomyces stellatus]|uniref:Aste57867_2755 protein n=1 Tax=Aphanomyces stellatus TaxID=120398 RepID=A0A485K878_9STRA|nr:hypothetical protein As57867_002748 [Aphanomyces stellatus]VFT79947.1 Aste57867_2755 [Aphanomyces stellatus]